MNNKKDLISGIVFYIYFAMMVLFVPMVFFYGQVIGGGVYFVCLAITIAYFILDLKFEFSFKKYYRFFVYINDIISILAFALFIYYGVYTTISIITLVILSLSFVSDMICKDRIRSKSKANIITNVANLVVMLCIFPYFFFDKLGFEVIFIGLIFAVLLFICKILLTVYSYKTVSFKETIEKKSELEKVFEDSVNDNVLE